MWLFAFSGSCFFNSRIVLLIIYFKDNTLKVNSFFTISLKDYRISFLTLKTDKNAFGYDSGDFEILVAVSSKDIRLKGTATVK
jgi:hypothetical protein